MTLQSLQQSTALGDASIFAKLRALATRLFAHAAARGKAQAGQTMKPRLLTSGLQEGIALIIQKDWSIEQALAVVALRGDQQKFICRHYHP